MCLLGILLHESKNEEIRNLVLTPLAIIKKTYIVAEGENGMYLIDQHAAHERILYEKVKNNYYNDEEKDSRLEAEI